MSANSFPRCFSLSAANANYGLRAKKAEAAEQRSVQMTTAQHAATFRTDTSAVDVELLFAFLAYKRYGWCSVHRLFTIIPSNRRQRPESVQRQIADYPP